MPSFIRNYFNSASHYSRTRFILELTIVTFLIKILFAAVVFTIFNYHEELEGVKNAQEDINRFGFFTMVILVAIVTPLIETPIGQMLPIWITSKFTNKDWIKVVTSSIFFASLHWPIQDIIVISPATIIFAWAYVTKRKISRSEAFIDTALIHGLHNLIASAFYLIK
jgi:membrane protease YdiL (CAAX protease family)